MHTISKDGDNYGQRGRVRGAREKIFFISDGYR